VRRAVAGGAGGGRSDAATASHLNAATFPESKEPRVFGWFVPLIASYLILSLIPHAVTTACLFFFQMSELYPLPHAALELLSE
jgi:hypothetical protein